VANATTPALVVASFSAVLWAVSDDTASYWRVGNEPYTFPAFEGLDEIGCPAPYKITPERAALE
jgi:hypothetical protein